MLRTSIAFTRACLLHLAPYALRGRAKQMLSGVDTMDIPEPAILFIQLTLLYLIYKRYPLPVLFSFLPRAKL